MADKKEETTQSLFLVPASNSFASDALRPVPVAASLFPDGGETDSFLGQETFDDQPNQQPSSQPSSQSQFAGASFFQGANATSDPFQNVSQMPPGNPPPQSSPMMMTSPQPPPMTSSPSLAGDQTVSGPPPVQMFSPAGTPQQSSAAQGRPHGLPQAHSLPPTHGPPLGQGPPQGHGPPQGPPPGSGPGGMYRLKDYKHKPMGHPMDSSSLTDVGPSPQAFPSPSPSAPQLQPGPFAGPPLSQGMQYDPSRPPPTNADLPPVNIHPPLSGVQTQYRPVLPHWFFCAVKGNIEDWLPFSTVDSSRLEEAYLRGMQNKNEIILSMNGGRYDVNLRERTRQAIYWVESPSKVRRCTWFYKSDGENKFVPYEEELAATLEEEYKSAALQNLWNRRLELPGGEAVVMHNPNVIVHFRPGATHNQWGSSDHQIRPRVVKRGVDDIEDINFGEPDKVDHLVFVIHGIGPVSDLRFRSIVECVEDFRCVSLDLMQSHFAQAVEDGRANRVEFLPVYWYDALHGDATGVDCKLKRITLPSILRLRRFTNDTLLDILFYSSPAYCQQIAEVVAMEINRLYDLFMERNPSFTGNTSLVGHSLGALIVFDLLSHQGREGDKQTEAEEKPGTPASLEAPGPDSCNSSVSNLSFSHLASEEELAEDKPLDLEGALEQLGLADLMPKFEEERMDMETLLLCEDSELKELGVPLGPRKKLRGFIKHTAEKAEKTKQLLEEKARLDAMKVAEEELTRSQLEQSTTSNGDSRNTSPSVHVDYTLGIQGVGQLFVKYPQLKSHPVNFFAMGSPIGMFLTVRGLDEMGEEYNFPTCPSFYNIFHPFDPVAYRVEPLVNPSLADVKPVLMPHHKGRKRFHLELRDSLTNFGADLKKNFMDSMKRTWRSLQEFALAHRGAEDGAPPVTDAAMEAVAEKLSQEQMNQKAEEAQHQREMKSVAEADLKLGQLNSGRRIDYVLQEAPFESFNEYLFALSSHTCYWNSEDTVLMVLKEIYSPLGIYSTTINIKDSEPPTPNAT